MGRGTWVWIKQGCQVLGGTAALRSVWLAIVYACLSGASLVLAYELRFDFDVPTEFRNQLLAALAWVVPLRLLGLACFRQLSGLPGFFSLPDLRSLCYAVGSGSLLILTWRFAQGIENGPPRGVLLTEAALILMSLAGFRVILRRIREQSNTVWHPRAGTDTGEPPGIEVRGTDPSKVGIIGAGYVGGSLARELLTKRRLGLSPVAFYDDNSGTWRSHVHGIPVLGPPEMLLEDSNGNRSAGLPRPWGFLDQGRPRLDEVIIAMPSAPARRMNQVVEILQRAGLRFRTVPAMDQLASGAVKVSNLRPVEISDLLGRDEVVIESENVRDLVESRTVMVTGAGGSIGSELCRQIASFSPERLLLVEQSEVQMFVIEQELIESGYQAIIQPCIGNVLDPVRMHSLFEHCRPDIVFHAAAHKHVPLMESHPGEAIKNNTFGTMRVAELCLAHGVERLVLISTDKAINPTNVMGASKRLAEMFLQSLYARHPEATKMMAVRFGNVLGSSGSVIPTFQRQIARGGPVKITHPQITRYFMTIPEAVSLVLQSGAQGRGGEIFVLDMGNPVRILDLAKRMISLSGLRLGHDIEIEFVGLRPGEKLYEELSYRGENIAPTTHPQIMRFVSEPARLEDLRAMFEELSRHLHTGKPNHLKSLLKQILPDYHPYLPGMPELACPKR